MRIIAIGFITLLAVAPASAQVPQPAGHPYGLDPYTPSDAMWLRTYGAALVAQTPLLELATLDPYKPSDAALLRQIGGGIPVCCLDGYWPGIGFGAPRPESLRGLAAHPAVPIGLPAGFIAIPTPSTDAVLSSPVAAASQTGPTSAVTLARPSTNDGISIRYDGQVWVSAGRAVPLQSAVFERVGEYSGFPVYRRPGTDGVIYVPTRNDMMAPYRLKP